ncbi:MAG: 2,3-bisphosphoglycerate-independent phosphoglycerate mutase [Flavobacteriales bacterium]|nr:2,3-bisphosphoglycerate-independent phosphoglycerate mutase [Flavobacteriales bacterium]MCB9449209.1 2,3-bisphosphoglycerate-independent phosphoglycerate mutase [Flavobacteriales bacterium]
MSHKAVLIILDGWGLGNGNPSDAIAHARTPFVDSLYQKYPHAQLSTSGEDVGLPAGQMGNSEVGHLNIGAGRIVYQDLVRINKAIREGELASNPVLKEALQKAKDGNNRLHLMGLCSDGGVHSHINHLLTLCDLAAKEGINEVYVHAFTDGRDCDPKSGLGFLKTLQAHLEKTGGVLAHIVGRYYAMDRDKRWERVKEAYDLMVHGTGKATKDMIGAVEASYKEDITDEFIRPIQKIDDAGQPVGLIRENDVVICFNYRTDRCREITIALTQHDIPEHSMRTLPLYYVTMTQYDATYKDVHVIFHKDNLAKTLGEVLADAGKTQIRIAETEKYPHVTFFFSGGREAEFKGEKRLMVSSPKVATYDLQPEMSAALVTSTIVAELNKGETDFVCLNFANPDMVGHTGVYDAIVKAVETVDGCLQQVVEAGLKHDYRFLIIADHGNADYVINADGSPNTAHTTNPVPAILIDPDHTAIRNGILADVAPTLLAMMGVEQPVEMTGHALIGEKLPQPSGSLKFARS